MEKVFYNYIPKTSCEIVEKWFSGHSFTLKITKKRQTKLGDFRVDNLKGVHQITVNGNLNEYAFLITLTHEFAHLLVWEKYKKRIKPHGKEWKNQFSALLMELLVHKVFPENIQKILFEHAKNPAASSVRDVELTRVLNEYNINNNIVYLSDVSNDKKFSLNNRVFIKKEKKRTRFLCQEIKTNKKYLIHGSAEILLVDN